MKARQLANRVHWMGAVDWDRRLFDSLVPLPDGTSYNAYLVEGSEKTALLDTVDPATADKLMTQLDTVPSIDFIVSHHAEQDHSGVIPHVLEKYPNATVLATSKAKPMLISELGIPESAIQTVADGETLSLGDKTLTFIHTPWVHWPETMVTYLEEDGILFSCDFFGSHLATSDLYADDESRIYEAAKRYYAEIMMPFRPAIEKNLNKLEPLDIRTIAPSHGPVYRRPSFIIDAYRDWIAGDYKNTVVLPFVSMHGSTRMMVDHLVSALVDNGVTVQRFDLAETDIGKLAMALVDAPTIVIGSPTVLAGPHPHAAYAALLANALRPRTKYLSVVGSYGWGENAIRGLAGMIPNLKVEVLDPVSCKGVPSESDKQALTALAATIAEKHRDIHAV